MNPYRRHLVLDVMSWDRPIDGRFLCGHDEHHWFVASLPFGRQTETVRGAMESLKPLAVRREQKRKGVSHRRDRRRTAAYVRQGEWFFLPRPRMHVDQRLIERNGSLVRGRGKPHRVEWLFHDGDFTFVRGHVSHPDHDTLHLDVWHRVERNTEPEPAAATQSFVRMAFLD